MSRRNRSDVLETVTTASPPPVAPLGQSPLHGPTQQNHVVLILGVGPGLGLAIARTFASSGYSTAIASRSKSRLEEWARELANICSEARQRLKLVNDTRDDSPQSLAFQCDVLSPDAIQRFFSDVQRAWPGKQLGTAIFNASIRKRGPFLEQKLEQLEQSVQASIIGGFTFMQTAAAQIKEHGQGGSILITGATSSIRGREGFAAFAASKGGLRQICQSVAREFGPEGIHVAHIVVDGLIDSQEARHFFGLNSEQRFADDVVLQPDEMAKTWLFLASQAPSAWTFEMDLRPAKEHF